VVKKLLATTITAAALSVPLAGVAWADPDNGVGSGGVPGQIGGSPGSGATPSLSDIAHEPGSMKDAIEDLTGFRFAPGGEVKLLTPGCGHGNGPKDVAPGPGC
jgi:hypothetical protein